MTDTIQYAGLTAQISSAEIERSFTDQETARVTLERGEFESGVVARGETEATIPSTSRYNGFGGIIKDYDETGGKTEVIIESFERFARDGELTTGSERYENAPDDVVVTDALDSTEELSAGTIETNGTVSKVFSHASPAKKIREAGKVTGGEVVYNPDKTVDFVERRGSTRTSTTISPSEQNIDGSFKVKNLSGGNDVTHLRVLGAGEGESQQTINLIPSDDPEIYAGTEGYENVVRYSADHYDAGDRRQWDSYSSKEVQDVDGLEELGRTIIDDIQTNEVEVETTLFNIDNVELGDTFIVNYPEKGVAFEEMSVVEMTEEISAKGVRYDVIMSTRRDSRQDSGKKERQDLSNYNMAFEGNSVAINTSGGRQPVTPTTKYETRIYYPSEVEYVHRLNLRVMGLPYRAYSSTGKSAGLHKHLVDLGFATPGASADADNVTPNSISRSSGSTLNIEVAFNLPEVGTAPEEDND